MKINADAGRELGQEVAGAAAAEHGRARAAAEHRADVRALAVLEQHDDTIRKSTR